MKMLFVHERFGALAGAEANAHATAHEFKRRGHEVGLLHGLGTGRGEAAWEDTFSGRAFSLVSKNGAAAVREALEKFVPDVMYVHNMPDVAVLEALLASAVPTVRMVHDHDLYCMRSYKYHYFSRRICERPASAHCVIPCGAFLKRDREGSVPLRWVSYSKKQKEIRLNQKFHRLVVATRYMKDELLRNGFDPARVEIHAPVPPRAASPIRSTFSDRNLVIYAGQITRGKGVDVLLESLAKVRTRFECWIFGDGHYRPYCEKLSARLGLQERVHFKGFVSQEQLKEYYSECSVAVMSSVWPEPFGAVGLEAMRYGVPVVAFDAGGIREWLTDGLNGRLVPWMDRARFAARVEALLLDKAQARQMGEHGRELLTQQFDFGDYITALEKMFLEVISESQGAHSL